MKEFGRVVAMTGVMFGLVAGARAQVSTTPAVPVSQWTQKWWFERFEQKKALAEANDWPVIFFGDSITHNWESKGKEVWEANFAEGPYRALNCGFSADRTEHLLWRLEHGQFGKARPKAIVLMIGTNNTGHKSVDEETPMDTVSGIRLIVKKLNAMYPESKVILHPIFPRGANVRDGLRFRNDLVNEMIREIADGRHVAWCDFNARLVAADGTLSTDMMADLLHPGKAGYEIWAEELKPYLDWALGRASELPKPGSAMVTAIEPKTNAAPVNASGCYGWFEDGRFQVKRTEIQANASHYFDLVMLGDSITHNWESVGEKVFERRFTAAGYKVLDLGFSGDQVQNLIWDCGFGGLLDGYRTPLVSIMIGTNNGGDSAEAVADGIKRLVSIVRAKQPAARVLLMPIFPRGKTAADPQRVKNLRTNEIVRRLADGRSVVWVDFTDLLVQRDGSISSVMMPDYLHPAEKGYEIWADALLPYLRAQEWSRQFKPDSV